MNIITILVCALVNQAASQTNEFNLTDMSPARILVQQKTISESSDLYATCSTFGFKKQIMVYVYLCKDDRLYEKIQQKSDQYDTMFTISSVGLNVSGNYSCVYSTNEYLPDQVAKRGENIIQIQVIANFLPADISVAGLSTLGEGDNVTLRCTLSVPPLTLGDCKFIQSYLTRNGNILQVQPFNVMEMEATFTIEGAILRDSGHYSCVVLPSKCIQEHQKILDGNNSVFVEVRESLFLRLLVSCGMTFILLLLGLCLWCVKKQGYPALGNQKESSQQANAIMLAVQQEQTEREALEAQYGDSFSSEETEGYQNAVSAEEGVYSCADDLPVRTRTECLYAMPDKTTPCSPDPTFS
ncbi:uncharacterized protein LOC109139642 [Larimichthys crocea]|uniref:uncharacterized protein LOC109139642 n=1 Tax=Larimichthys crocea TaxID=215358 RepID=UPI000F5D5CD3|nr:uncharacterized protein LOC109139642 [Larimichthys crocea]